ncbi:MAG: tetratricopeptide repeat protein [Candidatus Methylomirabilia bacterium]
MHTRHPFTRTAALVVAGALFAGCATTNVPPMGFQGQPFKPEADERRIWAKAEKEAQKLETLNKLYDDPLLEEYLARVADRLIPDQVKEAGGPGFRFAVFRDPSLNAFAMPHGRVYLHTGLLARLESEAQLATILAHELTHVTHRHPLRAFRDQRNKRFLFGAAGIAASLAVAVAAGEQARRGHPVSAEVLRQTGNVLLGLGLTLAYAASVTGYSRDLEREADEEGMARLVKAGYDPNEAPKVFELFKKDHGDRGPLETFFFGSHPRLAERIENATRLLRTRYAVEASEEGRVVDTPEFSLRLRTVIRENALLDLRAGRFNLAKAQLDRVLALTPRDPTAQLYYGDLYRLQAQRAKSSADKQDLARLAIERYEQASTLDPTFADPFRQLGFLYYQQQELDRAREAFQRYLALKPEAPDARRIKEYLLELER